MGGRSIAALHEAVADVAPDRECIVWRDRRLSWGDVTERTRRLAHGLLAAGVGGSPRPVDHGWESPHDHVALLLTNGNEYLEAMVGCWKARAAAINVNYRYTADELAYVLADSGATAIVYHARFAPIVRQARTRCPDLRLLVVVEDGSAVPPVADSVDYEAWLGASSPERPDLAWDGDDRYVVYTGGTTGRPKGVLWRQDDFLHSALGVTGSMDEIAERAARPNRPRSLPAPPFMHGAAHWNALSCWLAGGTVVIQSETDHLDPGDILDTCEREHVTSLLIVGDAFARPLADELRRAPRDLSDLRLLMTGGAILSPISKRQFLSLVPGLRILDVLGSSETGRHGVHSSDGSTDDEPGVFVASDSTTVLDDERRRPLRPGSAATGWLAQRGRVPLGYLGDRARTESTFPEIDGVVHAVAGDRAMLRADGRVELLGRDSVTINTGGEKVHAEEVEQALKDHPSVYDVLVVGLPSAKWGQEVIAVVAPIEGCDGLDPAALAAHVGDRLARFKLPKQYIEVDQIERSASGKPDYPWARAIASARAGL